MGQTLRLGIVGTGMIANIIAEAITQTPAVELTAVASREIGRAAEFAKRYGSGKAFASWSKLLEWDGIDAVYVAVPTALKEEICIASAEAKKHLLADKPFSGLNSLRRITKACRDNRVAFLDATHFVHHPRTSAIKEYSMAEIGETVALRTSFYAPVDDHTNIRFDPRLEPAGALGDLAWYSMRAIVEYLGDLPIESLSAFAKKDAKTGAFLRAGGFFRFDNDVTSTWEVGYDVGAGVMDLDLMGSQAMITVEDFVLDWRQGLPDPDPQREVGFTIRRGMTTPKHFQFIPVRTGKSAKVLMLEKLARLALDADSAGFNAEEINAAKHTQRLLDLVLSEIGAR